VISSYTASPRRYGRGRHTASFSQIPIKPVSLPLFAVFKPSRPQPNHAGIAQLQLIALDEGLHSLFTPLFADFTFHPDSFPSLTSQVIQNKKSIPAIMLERPFLFKK
jgi:hypothetical protein